MHCYGVQTWCLVEAKHEVSCWGPVRTDSSADSIVFVVFSPAVPTFAVAVILCDQLPEPANGSLALSNRTIFGSVAEYSCNDGFLLEGDTTTRLCTSDGWTGSEPTCRGMKSVIDFAGLSMASSHCQLCLGVDAPILQNRELDLISFEFHLAPISLVQLVCYTWGME